MKKYKFIFITGAYNAERYADRYFENIFNQTYKNFNIWYTCDGCTDDTYDIAKKYLRQQDILTVNPYENRGPMSSTMKNLSHHDKYKSDSIIYIYLDGDDWLYGNDVLEYLNTEFQNDSTWMVYNGCNMVYGLDVDSPSEKRVGEDDAYTEEEFNVGLRKVYRWKGMHLKAWRASLWSHIDTNRYKMLFHAGDRAWFFDLADLCGFDHIKTLKKPLMVYNLHNPINHHKVHGLSDAKKEITFISNMTPLRELQNLSNLQNE